MSVQELKERYVYAVSRLLPHKIDVYKRQPEGRGGI